MTTRVPHIVGIGGTTRANSSSERALRVSLAHAESIGAKVTVFGGEDLATLPHYDPGLPDRVDVAARLVAALRDADGVIIASPAYHGAVSGMVKNALDYVEDMREDELSYFDGRAVGIIACGYGWQAIVATMNQLRTVVHALRGWVTPLGAGVNSLDGPIDENLVVADDKTAFQLQTVANEVVWFARQQILARAEALDLAQAKA